MNRSITQRELRNDSSAILREVQAGQALIVTRNGVPVAELRPVPPRRFVPRAIIADAALRAPRVDAGRFRADLCAPDEPAVAAVTIAELAAGVAVGEEDCRRLGAEVREYARGVGKQRGRQDGD